MSSNSLDSLILYSTSACHLCEQAEALIQEILPQTSRYLSKIDIAMDHNLMVQYGSSIPVLVKIDEKGLPVELFWPFDKNKVIVFLGS